MKPSWHSRTIFLFALLLLICEIRVAFADQPIDGNPINSNDFDQRGCVDLCVAASGEWLITANQLSNSISLIRTADGVVLDEQQSGKHPSAIELGSDGQSVFVSCSHSGEVYLFDVGGARLKLRQKFFVGGEPLGLAVTSNGKRAYVGLVAAAQVAELDLVSGRVSKLIDVGQWPRYLAVSPDSTRLAVGCSGDSKVVVVDTSTGDVLYDEVLSGGINLGHMQTSDDGKYVYFPWMIYRTNPINPRNIRLGWVLASRIGRVRLDGPAYREAISLDVPGLAIADPHGLAINSDQKRMVVAASGTHELLVYRLPDLPFVGAGGPGDLIDARLARDKDRFDRIELGGRPMSVKMLADQRTALVANDLKNCVQVVDIEEKRIVREIPLGPSPSTTLVQRGREIFYDGRRSLDQWYSCHTCHYDGGSNSKAMDTMNDGTEMTTKTVIPLFQVSETKPWTWHGWQTDLADAMQKSFTHTMQGKPASEADLNAIIAYLSAMRTPPNPNANHESTISAVERGKAIFASKTAACIDCHHGAQFTDGLVHEVGLTKKSDRYQGFNTPSLLGTYRKVRWLHDGRAKSLEAVLTGVHAPEKVNGERALSSEELADLVAYLRSL